MAGLLSAIRLRLARGSRPASGTGDNGDGPASRRAPPLRARVLGALLVGNIVLDAAGTAIGTRLALEAYGASGLAYAIAGISVAIVAVEALARLAASQGLIDLALRPLGLRIDRYAEKLSATDEIRGQLDLLHQSGGVVKEERDMLGGLLDLKELSVSEVMVHRTKMRTVDADLPPAEIVSEVLRSPYTRLPLWRGTPENIVGVVHAKDLLRAIEAQGERGGIDVEAIATTPWFVPDTTSLRDQLTAFLARKQHVALVVDEYGDLMGLLTLEDILEEIVGEISDEHDVASRGVRPQPDGSVLVDGSLPIRDLNRMMDWSLPDEEATTVAGLVIHEAMLIPDPGQVFNFHGFRFEVMRRVRNRVTALRVAKAERAAEGQEGGAAPRSAEA
ncbi:HlyC/CorC family transporter [uncultured Enterovirga sp.]|uniref:HlyC/CorC family transporter n=1 Tax=uncultured Enterovirga sp. TaxID=2026352 RepID=UPI0035CC9FE8